MIDPVFKELKLIKPLLASIAIALAFLFIGNGLMDNKCGCGGDCECSCVGDCVNGCDCDLAECKAKAKAMKEWVIKE
tara:strand:+ start:889 stop:1119 length:231 start_codon:yes stop_codon:yes gene_type:complete